MCIKYAVLCIYFSIELEIGGYKTSVLHKQKGQVYVFLPSVFDCFWLLQPSVFHYYNSCLSITLWHFILRMTWKPTRVTHINAGRSVLYANRMCVLEKLVRFFLKVFGVSTWLDFVLCTFFPVCLSAIQHRFLIHVKHNSLSSEM